MWGSRAARAPSRAHAHPLAPTHTMAVAPLLFSYMSETQEPRAGIPRTREGFREASLSRVDILVPILRKGFQAVPEPRQRHHLLSALQRQARRPGGGRKEVRYLENPVGRGKILNSSRPTEEIAEIHQSMRSHRTQFLSHTGTVRFSYARTNKEVCWLLLEFLNQMTRSRPTPRLIVVMINIFKVKKQKGPVSCIWALT